MVWGPLPDPRIGDTGCEGWRQEFTNTLIRRLIRHIEGLEVTQGEGLGGPLRLFPWERLGRAES